MKKLLFILVVFLPISLLAQKKTIRGDLVVKGRSFEMPYGTYNLSEYLSIIGTRTAWKDRYGTVNLYPLLGKQNALYQLNDTINISGPINRIAHYNLNHVYLNTVNDVSITSSSYGWSHILVHENYEAAGANTVGHRFVHDLWPKDGDTVEIAQHQGILIQTGGFTGIYPTSRVDIDALVGVQIFGNIDEEMAIDSIIALKLHYEDDGADPDSIGAFYAIGHFDDSGVRGANRTYFFYSEYGDAYLNGDMEVTGLIKNTPPHASMSFSDESETLTMDQNDWVKLTNATDNLFATTDATGITQAGDSLTIVAPGDYIINASVSFSGTTNADVYEFAVFKNNTLASPKIERTTTSTDIGNISLPIYLSGLVPGDDISLRIRNTANDFDATLISCSWITWSLHLD